MPLVEIEPAVDVLSKYCYHPVPHTVQSPVLHYHLGWLPEVLRLVKADQLEEGLDILFRTLNRWLNDGNFQACDELLEKVAADQLNLNLSLGILSLTKPASKFLKHRSKFYRELKASLVDCRPDWEALLKGLGD